MTLLWGLGSVDWLYTAPSTHPHSDSALQQETHCCAEANHQIVNFWSENNVPRTQYTKNEGLLLWHRMLTPINFSHRVLIFGHVGVACTILQRKGVKKES